MSTQGQLGVKAYLEANFAQVFEKLRHARLRIRVAGTPRLEEPVGIFSMNEEPSGITVDDVWELNENEIYIEFRAVYSADVFGFLFRADAASLREDSVHEFAFA